MIDEVHVLDRIWSLDDEYVKVVRDERVVFEVKPLDMKMKRKSNPTTKLDHVCIAFANVMNSLDVADFEVRIEINRDDSGEIFSIFQCFDSEVLDLEIRIANDFDGDGIYVRELKNMNSNIYRIDEKDLCGVDSLRFENILRFVDKVLPIDKFVRKGDLK